MSKAGAKGGAGRQAGVPLRWVVIGAIVLVVGTIGFGYLYFRSLGGKLFEEAPREVIEVAADEEDATRALGLLDAARQTAGEVALSEDSFNRLLYGELLSDPLRNQRLRLKGPFLELSLSNQVEPGRWLNGVLMTQMYPSPEGLGVKVLAGQIGKVSISRTEGEWARVRIERQLMHELQQNERLRGRFDGLSEVQVEDGRVRLKYRVRG
ncbi:MAG: hypothetical protein ACYTFT_13125 [Planctomycetota bacterium]|jgi:hypothetical protein